MRRLEEVGLPSSPTADAMIVLHTPIGDHQYSVEIKSRVTASSAAAVASPADRRLLVVAPYVPEGAAEIWRSHDIHYVDTAGNMFVHLPGLHIDIRGRRNPERMRSDDRRKPLRAFRPSGLRVLFVLLCEPEATSLPMRDIAYRSRTSLGTTQLVIRELEQEGFISATQGSRQLFRTHDLFDRWTEAYTLELHPRLTLAQFDAPEPSWWTKADEDLMAENGQWGGETAAHIRYRHLRPGRTIIYARKVPTGLAVKYRFRKATDDGNVEIREQFWAFGSEGETVVPSPLIYADLIASAEPRQLEAATDLRERDGVLRRLDGR